MAVETETKTDSFTWDSPKVFNAPLHRLIFFR